MSIEVYAIEERWPVDGFSGRSRRLGVLDKFSKATFTEIDLDVGSWSVEFPLPEAGALVDYWRSINFPAIEAYDTESGWRFAGYVTEIKTRFRPGSGATVIISGMDFMGDIANRLALPNPNQPLDHWMTNLYGQWEVLNASHDLINENIITSVDGRRVMAGFSIQPWINSQNIPSPQFKVEGQPILQMVRQFCEGTPYTVRTVLDRSVPDRPDIEVRFYARPTNRRVIHVDQAKVEEVVVSERAATATDVILMGEQSAPPAEPRWVSRQSSPLGSAALPPSWRHRVREKFFNRPSTGLDSIHQEAQALLDGEDSKILVALKGLELENFGFEMAVGDIIKVNLGEFWRGAVIDIPIKKSTLTITPDSVSRTVDVGDFEAEGPAGVYRDLQRLGSQVRRIEDKAHQ